MPKGLSNRAFAARLEKSEAAVRKADKAGRIVRFDDGSIDEEASRQRWSANADPARTTVRSGSRSTQRSGDPLPELTASAVAEASIKTTRVREILAAEGITIPEGESLDFDLARTAEKIVQTWERDRAHAEAAGRMIDAATAQRRWEGEMVKLRARLLAVSGKISMRLAHLTPHEVQEIDRIVRDAMAAAAGDDDDAVAA